MSKAKRPRLRENAEWRSQQYRNYPRTISRLARYRADIAARLDVEGHSAFRGQLRRVRFNRHERAGP